MRILVISNLYPSAEHPAFGTFVKARVEALRDLGAEVRVVANQDPAVHRRVTAKYASLALWAGIAAAGARLRGPGFDIVEAHIAYPTGLIARPAARLVGAPLVLFAHGADVFAVPTRSTRHARLAASTYGAASLIVANSRFLAGEIGRRYPGVADRVRVLSPGIELQQFTHDPAAPRSGVLFVGRLIPDKGVDVLIRAMATLGAGHVPGEGAVGPLTVLGDGPERTRLVALAETLGVDLDARGGVDRVAVADAMRRAAVVAVPSVYREPLGLVAIEAMASGAIVVASATGGLVETVVDGVTGLAVSPGDVGCSRRGDRPSCQPGDRPDRGSGDARRGMGHGGHARCQAVRRGITRPVWQTGPMILGDLGPLRLAGLAVLIGVVGVFTGRWVARRTGWAPAGGIALLVATPLVPFVPVIGGLSLDDVLPLVGIAFLASAVDLRRLKTVRVPRLLMAGLLLAIVAGILSSLVNASSPSQALAMLLRSPGRYAFLAVIVVLVALAEPADRRRILVARSMALLGTVEAAFGLAAFFLPLGGIGLEPTRKFSVLYFEVPGRIAGTLGISPNFLGAIFIMTILLTAGLATDARGGRERTLLWASVLVQTLALTLTFTRASLGLAIVVLAVLLLVRGRIRYLVPVLCVVAIGFATTPARAPVAGAPGTTGTPGTEGPRVPVAVERLTSDIPDRFALWYSASIMMLDHPLAGVGPGRMVEVAKGNPDRYMNTPVGSATNSAHNTILMAGAEAGIVAAGGALLVNVALGLLALRVVFSPRRRRLPAIETAGALAVLGYLAQGMVNNLFNVAASGVVFAVVVGAYVVLLKQEPSLDEAQRQRAPTGPPVELTL